MQYLSLLGFGAGYIVLCVLGGLILIGLVLFCILVPIKAWLTGILSKAYVSIAKLISMKFRKLNPMQLVEGYCMAKKAQVSVTISELEALVLAGGSCKNVLSALSLASSAKLQTSFAHLKAIELSGKDVMQVVEDTLHSRVILVSDIRGVAQNDIELIASVRATVKTKLDAVLSGTAEDTLRSKISKHVMMHIAMAPRHSTILEKPNSLVDGLLAKQYDAGSIYQLLSVEVAQVEVGRDIGAELAAKSSERERAMAQIEAERMKNTALIREQQMKAKLEEMKADVLAAEAEVPRAIAEAIAEGRFSVMDYYKLMNLQADTAMRRSIISKDDGNGGEG